MNALNDQLKTLRLSHAAKALEQQSEQNPTAKTASQAQSGCSAEPTYLQRGTKPQSQKDERTANGQLPTQTSEHLDHRPNRRRQNLSWLRSGNQRL